MKRKRSLDEKANTVSTINTMIVDITNALK